MKIVREYLFEKFTEDSDPITDMGIGMLAKIDEYIKTHDSDGYVKRGLESRAEYLAQVHDSDQDKIKEWIEFLCRNGLEKPQDWNEEYAANMIELKVNFAKNLEQSPSAYFSFERDESDGNYFLYVDTWEDFVEMFQYSRNTASKDYIKQTLSGEGNFDYFYHSHDDYDLGYVLQELNNEQQSKLYSYLISEYTELEESGANNLAELFEYIESEENKLENKLLKAWANYRSLLEEITSFYHLVGAIKNYFDIFEEIKNNESLKFKITEKGLNKLFAAYFLSSEYGIWYNGDNVYYDLKYIIEDYIEEIENTI